MWEAMDHAYCIYDYETWNQHRTWQILRVFIIAMQCSTPKVNSLKLPQFIIYHNSMGLTPLRIVLLHMPLAWAAVSQGLKWAGMSKTAPSKGWHLVGNAEGWGSAGMTGATEPLFHVVPGAVLLHMVSLSGFSSRVSGLYMTAKMSQKCKSGKCSAFVRPGWGPGMELLLLYSTQWLKRVSGQPRLSEGKDHTRARLSGGVPHWDGSFLETSQSARYPIILFLVMGAEMSRNQSTERHRSNIFNGWEAGATKSR